MGGLFSREAPGLTLRLRFRSNCCFRGEITEDEFDEVDALQKLENVADI